MYDKPLLPKVIQISKHVQITTTSIELFIQQVKFLINIIQFQTDFDEHLTESLNLNENSTSFL